MCATHYSDVIMSRVASQINGVFDCLLNRLFRRRSKKTSKLRVIGLCEGNSPVTGEFPAQKASDAGKVSIWWRHHVVKWRTVIYDPCRRPRPPVLMLLLMMKAPWWWWGHETGMLKRKCCHFHENFVTVCIENWTSSGATNDENIAKITFPFRCVRKS